MAIIFYKFRYFKYIILRFLYLTVFILIIFSSINIPNIIKKFVFHPILFIIYYITSIKIISVLFILLSLILCIDYSMRKRIGIVRVRVTWIGSRLITNREPRIRHEILFPPK